MKQQIKKYMPNPLRKLYRRFLLAKEPNQEPPSVRIDLKKKFTEVYERNLFEGGDSLSGEGSDLVQTDRLRIEVPKLLKKMGVSSILDAPCGDYFWMKEVDLPVDRYHGIDVVQHVVEKNSRMFSSEKVEFSCRDITKDKLPEADLIFSRDCLVHLSFADCLDAIRNYKSSGARYLLATTFTNREANVDFRGPDDFWRTLNLQLEPFNFPPPISLINEGCTEQNGEYSDKCLGLWELESIKL